MLGGSEREVYVGEYRRVLEQAIAYRDRVRFQNRTRRNPKYQNPNISAFLE